MKSHHVAIVAVITIIAFVASFEFGGRFVARRQPVRSASTALVPTLTAWPQTTSGGPFDLTFAVSSQSAGSAAALENPLVLSLHRTVTSVNEASATIFGTGSAALVDVVDYRAIPDGSAITLNRGGCLRPGPIAFALSRFNGADSLTLIAHSLADVAIRSGSMVIHTTAQMTSPPFACSTIFPLRASRANG